MKTSYSSLFLLAALGGNAVRAFTVPTTTTTSTTTTSTRLFYGSMMRESLIDRGIPRSGGGRIMDDRMRSLNNRIGAFDRAAPGGFDEPPLIVQGGSLKTWSFPSLAVERVQVVLQTEGRPLDADIELWQGPDNTPHKMRVYSEDGGLRPIRAVMETPRGPNTIAIRNIGQLEFPMDAYVVGDTLDGRSPNGPLDVRGPADMTTPARTIQGGALRTFPFEPVVESVQVMLQTDGRPLRARIELLQGPNNNKQVIEAYTEDGLDRPFFIVIETPGSGNVVRVVNSATVEFPMTAWVEPYAIGDGNYGYEYGSQAVIGGDSGTGSGFMTSTDRRSLAW